MASATLNTLVGASKPAVTNTGGIAAALLAAGGGSSSGAGAASSAGAAAGAAGGGTSSAPATIMDFLAMLSGMIETPEGSATSGAAATAAVNPDAIKSDAQGKGGDDMSELYAQLLALMQGGAGDASAQNVPTATGGPGTAGAVLGADGAGAANAAGSPGAAGTTDASASSAAAAAQQTSAQQTAADDQRALIAKLLGQSGDADDADGSTSTDAGGKGIASLLEKDLQSLFGTGNGGATSGSPVSLSDLSALLGQGANGANPSAAQTGPQPDPSLLQAATAAAPAGPAAATPTADSASAANAHLTAPVGTAAWADQLGTHLTWMAGNDQQSASLKLTPPHLGPLEIQITMGDDNKASVWFSAPHADTRAALGEALPRLRELFGASGLTLADANVSREPSKQKPRSQTPDASVSRIGAISGDDPTSGVSARLAALHAGILDTYA